MAKIKQAVILAAGRGSRLNHRGRPKPLVPFLGMPLIERAIRGFAACGIKKVLVVTGYKADEVEGFLDGLNKRVSGIDIGYIRNEEWELGNGSSFLSIKRAKLKGDFILSMCDHVFSKDLMERMLFVSPPKGGMCLLVDKRLKNSMVDRDDVTKVIVKNGNIKAIGKEITGFNGYDTGLFVCSYDVFENFEEEDLKKDVPLTLSNLVARLCKKGLIRSVETKRGFWADLDDKRAFKRAEKMLFVLLRSKGRDGPISRLLNRPISIRLTSLLVNTPVTPNQITLISFFLAVVASFFLARDSYLWFAMGGIMAQIASIIDGCDGEIARLKWLQSDYGAWLDAVLDRYADAFLIAAVTWHVANYKMLGNTGWLLGIFALIGSFINSYTADKYDGWMRRQKRRKRIRLGRDVRIFLVFLSGIFYRPVELLIMLAGIMHTENIRRIWQLRTA